MPEKPDWMQESESTPDEPAPSLEDLKDVLPLKTPEEIEAASLDRPIIPSPLAGPEAIDLNDDTNPDVEEPTEPKRGRHGPGLAEHDERSIEQPQAGNRRIPDVDAYQREIAARHPEAYESGRRGEKPPQPQPPRTVEEREATLAWGRGVWERQAVEMEQERLRKRQAAGLPDDS